MNKETTAMAAQTLDPDSNAARRLLALSDAYMAALYPAESNHLESAEALQQPHVQMVGIEVAGELVACGAVMLLDDPADGGRYGEIKRVFVLDSQRGRGHSRRIMAALEDRLRQRGVLKARLETGIHQPEALGLYLALGYQARGPFGAYRPDPLSVFMEKCLDA